MPFGITAKLFLALLLTNLATAIAVGVGVRLAFDRGFERYVQEREESRQQRLASAFAEAYREHGSWEFLRGKQDVWLELNHAARPSPRDLPPPIRIHDREPGDRFGEHRPGMGNGPLGGPPPGSVRDNDGQLIAGEMRAGETERAHPILVNGRQVGTLVNPVRPTGFDMVDRRLQQAMGDASLGIAAVATLFSALAAFLLARMLLAPVRRLTAATRLLADGRYATRVESTSRDELGRLADDFNRLGHTLEKNESSRRAFMADVSHELRTPLAVLKGELEAVQDGVRAPDAEVIASLQAEVSRLNKLVDDLHEVALADVGGLAYHFENVDAGVLVRTAIDHAAGRLAAASLTAHVEAPARAICVRGDENRLAQLVGNLLENSMRYTDPGGEIRVSLERREAHALLAWEDSKPGVPADALPRLFERLYRVEPSRNRGAGGSGLGLSIAQSIVQAHGGRIEAKASTLGGVRIEVLLPLADAP